MSNWYRAGTVAVTNGSTSVTGSGTAWIANIAVSDAIHLPDGRIYEVTAISSDTTLTIDKGYLGSTASGQAYAIQPTRGVVRETYDLLNQVRSNISGYMAGALSGKFPNGTAALPSISFADDIDTGLSRPAANQIGIATGGTQRLLLTTAACQVDLPITGTAVTQSATDATAGRVMRVGAFGLGVTGNAPVLDNIDATNTPSGLYRTTSSSLGEFPAGSNQFGHAIVHRHNTDTVWQTYIPVGNAGGSAGKFWHRIYNPLVTSWLPWRLVYDQGTVLGTVSQSGGVPTGALIETGTNANGEYVRFADGTQMCWHVVDLDGLAPNTASGSLFRLSAALGPYAYPAAFSGPVRHAEVSLHGSDNGVIRNGSVGARLRRGATTKTIEWGSVDIFTTSSDPGTAGEITRISLFAIGRWF